MTIRRMREVRGGMMSSWPNGWGWNDPAAVPPPGMYTQQRAGVSVTPHTILQIGVVHRCIEVITNSILQMGDPRAFTLMNDPDNRPYRQYASTQPQILSNTWALGGQTEGTTRSVVSLAMFGECFWYTLAGDKMGYPSALEVLNPLFVTVDADDNGMPIYYYGTGLNRTTLVADKVTHIQGLTMPGARRSLSSVEYESVSYALAIAAMEYGQRWFAQGASPSFVLSTDQKIGKEEVERIAQKFLVEHSGLQSSHLPLVVDSGLKVQKIQSTPDEAQFLGTLQYARKEIAGYFGVPPHLVGEAGDQGGVWGKGLEEMNFGFIDYTLSGYMTRLDEAYTSLLPTGVYAAFNQQALARANAADRAKEVQQLRLGTVMTPNEIRRDYYDLPPVEGGALLDAPLASNVAPAPAPDDSDTGGA